MPPALRWAVAGWCVWAALACGALFEAKSWGYHLEPMRLLASLALLLLAARGQSWFGAAAGAGVAYLAGSALWLYSFRRAYQAVAQPAYA